MRIHRWDKSLLFRSTVPVDLVGPSDCVIVEKAIQIQVCAGEWRPSASEIAGPRGVPFARLVPASEKVCVGLDLAEGLARVGPASNRSQGWHRDLRAARKILKAPAGKCR